ncbi:MAG: hypothetical protein ACE5E5_03790 [Phycisphaerae bacterium]
MADDAKNPEEVKAPKSGKMMQLAIIVSLMAAEGVGVFFVAQAMGPDPDQAAGAEMGEGDGSGDIDGKPEYVEIELAQCRTSNKMSGKIINFQMRVTGLVLSEREEEAKELVKSNNSRIFDRLNFVIRSAEMRHLNEPELKTIKRRLKMEFDRIFGDPGLIQEIVIPELLQSGSGV